MLNSLGTISKFLGTISESLRTFLTDFPGLFLIQEGDLSGLREQPTEEISALYKKSRRRFRSGDIRFAEDFALSGRRQKHAEPTRAKLIVDPL